MICYSIPKFHNQSVFFLLTQASRTRFKILKIMYVILLLFSLFLVVVHCAQKEARGGRWSDAKNWCPEGLPGDGDDVSIENVDVLFDAQTTARLGVINIGRNASLRFEAAGDANAPPLQLVARTVLVQGYFETGTKAKPLARRVDIVLINDETPIARADDLTERLFVKPYGAKMIGVYGVCLFLTSAIVCISYYCRMDDGRRMASVARRSGRALLHTQKLAPPKSRSNIPQIGRYTHERNRQNFQCFPTV
jgi:hypothetical protein